jgi:hypothetical protein
MPAPLDVRYSSSMSVGSKLSVLVFRGVLSVLVSGCAESTPVGDAGTLLSCEEARGLASAWLNPATEAASSCTSVEECTMWVPSQSPDRTFGLCAIAVRRDAVDALEAGWSAESVRIGMLSVPCNEGVLCVGTSLACTEGRCTIEE